jgi:hypothetical protein
LAAFGGRTIKENVGRLLKEVLTNGLAEKYNWLGQKGKLPIGSLKLIKVIFSKYLIPKSYVDSLGSRF